MVKDVQYLIGLLFFWWPALLFLLFVMVLITAVHSAVFDGIRRDADRKNTKPPASMPGPIEKEDDHG